MADYNLEALQSSANAGSTRLTPGEIPTQELWSSAVTAAIPTYVMVGRDAGAGYVTWLATTYDSAGAGYAGATPTPVGAFVVGSAFAIAVYTS